MQMVAAYSGDETEFEIPDGWVTEVRRRGRGSKAADKYYHEPHTGRQFRSLPSIKRYLYGEEEPRMPQSRPRGPEFYKEGSTSSETVMRIVCGGKLWNLDEREGAQRIKDLAPATAQHSVCSILPDGWMVEEVPRRCGTRSDRYFIEPETRSKFRSVPEVRRYLTSTDKFPVKYKALEAINLSMPPTSPCHRKMTHSVLPELTKPDNFDIFSPPEKINWVRHASKEETWTPFLEELRIPDHVKEIWQHSFFLGMTGSKHQIPQLTMGDPPYGA